MLPMRSGDRSAEVLTWFDRDGPVSTGSVSREVHFELVPESDVHHLLEIVHRV